MKQETFDFLSNLIYRESGIVLPPEKKMLLENRVQKRLRALNLRDVSDYLRIIELDVDGDELVQLIDVVSTNVTYFYREPRHFEIYAKLLKQFQSEKRNEVKVWCAAASSGQEPYTLAIEAAESLDLGKTRFRLLGTDICTKVLNRALAGHYHEREVEKIAPDKLQKYFDRQGNDFHVRSKISDLVLFKKLNLIQFPYPLKGSFDIIFCRNVMIYFDTPTRAKIIAQFEKLLSPGGYLFLSHSENLLGIDHGLQRFDSSVFRKP